jgi:integrase
MGVKIKKRGGKWYVFVNYHGRRKAKCVGSSRQLAEQVKRQLEAKLALGDLGFLADKPTLTFREYAERWLKTDAKRSKESTVNFYREYQARYVLPVFGTTKIDDITREAIKAFMADLSTRGLSRNTIRLAVASLRVVLSSAVEDGLITLNPAFRLGRFMESQKREHEAQAMEPGEVERFLANAKEHGAFEYYVLFLIALRAGLRQGEILGLRWGDFQFGEGESDSNRFILVQRRFYRGQFSTPKGNRSRRVDMSRELRRELLLLRDVRMLEAFQGGHNSIADDLVFPGESDLNPISPRTIGERYFVPTLERAGLRRVRFHDLRHTFGSLLIEAGAPLPYVRDQMGHSSIQITADKYVHLISGRNVGFIDRLDTLATPQQNATGAQPATQTKEQREPMNNSEAVEEKAWCERGDSNPHGLPRQILSLVRLPISPLSHKCDSEFKFS